LEFVQEVRSTFFKYLKPFLEDVPGCIKNMKDVPDTERVFTKYFDKQKYLNLFSDSKEYQKFAKQILTSSQFQHFCDDYFMKDELNNYRIFFSIVRKPYRRDSQNDDDKKQNCNPIMEDSAEQKQIEQLE